MKPSAPTPKPLTCTTRPVQFLIDGTPTKVGVFVQGVHPELPGVTFTGDFAGYLDQSPPEQVATQAVRDFATTRNLTLSEAFHVPALL